MSECQSNLAYYRPWNEDFLGDSFVVQKESGKLREWDAELQLTE